MDSAKLEFAKKFGSMTRTSWVTESIEEDHVTESDLPEEVQLLLGEIDQTEEDILRISNGKDYGVPVTHVDFGKDAWNIYGDSAADIAAKNAVKDLWEDMGPEGFNADFIQHYAYVPEVDAREMAIDIEAAQNEESEEPDDNLIAEIADKIAKDPISYFVDEMGLYNDAKDFLDSADFVQFRLDDMFSDMIDADGRDHFLSPEGDGIQLGDGSFYAYKVK